MRTREIVLKIMEARGPNVADRPMADTVRIRVSAFLRGLRERRQRAGATSERKWNLPVRPTLHRDGGCHLIPARQDGNLVDAMLSETHDTRARMRSLARPSVSPCSTE